MENKDRNYLWVRVIRSLHEDLIKGENWTISLSRNKGWSRWWRDVVHNGSGDYGKWFWKNLVRVVGDRGDIKF